MTPTWLAIREAARRWLKAIEVKLIGSPVQLGFLQGLGPRIADHNPRIVQTLDFSTSVGPDIFEVQLDGSLLVRFGGDEPEEHVCWVTDENPIRVQEFAMTLLDLASAGYPGCASCGGADEGSWDEPSSRAEQAVEAGNDS